MASVTAPIVHSDDEQDDIADFASYTDEMHNSIRLKSGINVQDLLREQGVFFEPEDISRQDDFEGTSHQYFEPREEEIEEHIKSQLGDLTDNAGDDPNLTDFERKAKGMTSIFDNNLIRKRIIKPGLECEGCPPERAAVIINYTCSIEDQDEPYDSTYLRGRPERHRIGDGKLLIGIELAVKSMKKQEKSEFLIEPSLAFGSQGCPPRIPGNAQILARLELLDFVEEGEADAILALPIEERSKTFKFDDLIKVAGKEHREGNQYVKKKEFKLAAKCYERAVKLLEDTELANDEEESRQKRLLKKLQANRGYCYLNCNWPKKACIALQDGMKLQGCEDPDIDCKMYFRLGLAKKKLANFMDALRNLERARHFKPNDPEIGKEIQLVERIIAKEKEDEKALYGRMLNRQSRPHQSNKILSSSRLDKDHNYADDDYSEIVEQLECFKLDDSQRELPLPSGMEYLLPLVKRVSQELNLSVETMHNRSMKIVKK